MCYNENISLFSYFTGITGSLALLSKKKIPEALFYGWVSQMQIVDYMLWKNQPCQISENNKICSTMDLQNCNHINKTTSAFGIIINHLEPLILFGSIMLFSQKKLPLYVIILFCIFMILIILYTIDVFRKDNLCTTVSETSDPYLKWNWNSYDYNVLIYSFFLIILILLSYYGLENGILKSLLILISYLITYFIYKDKKVVGSMWCFMAAFSPWLIYILEK